MKFTLTALLFFLNISASPGADESFQIGADNTDDAIRSLKTLTGFTIAEIEDRARPCEVSTWKDCSTEGFIGKTESFLTRLVTDNNLVHSKQLTHQQLAEPMFLMMTLPKEHCKHRNDGIAECTWNGIRFEVLIYSFFGFQESIFNDDLRTDKDFAITRMPDGATLTFSGMIPGYIMQYGFYEGETFYRVAPDKIISFFNIK